MRRNSTRNHRKIVVVDGEHGWVGGLNIGEEYLGRDPALGAMRDTHLRLSGPAAIALQLAFLEDWHWATGGKLPQLDCVPKPVAGGVPASAELVARSRWQRAAARAAYLLAPVL